jgi:hypothetical protein
MIIIMEVGVESKWVGDVEKKETIYKTFNCQLSIVNC